MISIFNYDQLQKYIFFIKKYQLEYPRSNDFLKISSKDLLKRTELDLSKSIELQKLSRLEIGINRLVYTSSLYQNPKIINEKIIGQNIVEYLHNGDITRLAAYMELIFCSLKASERLHNVVGAYNKYLSVYEQLKGNSKRGRTSYFLTFRNIWGCNEKADKAFEEKRKHFEDLFLSELSRQILSILYLQLFLIGGQDLLDFYKKNFYSFDSDSYYRDSNLYQEDFYYQWEDFCNGRLTVDVDTCDYRTKGTKNYNFL